MSKLEIIVDELRSLPPQKLDAAATYIHQLTALSDEERRAILARTAGSLSPAEADDLERIIEAGCEQIDERDW